MSKPFFDRRLVSEHVNDSYVGSEDSDDATPTNSPPPSNVAFPPSFSSVINNYPSSKTSGFWDDQDLGRQSQFSNYSNDSSMSWGDDNFEGEATKQVIQLFDQVDDLLYRENRTKIQNYPLVPLLKSSKHSEATEKGNRNRNSNRSFRSKGKLKQSVKIESDVEDSDSADEVVWEPLESTKKHKPSTSPLIRQQSINQKKLIKKKLSTIEEQQVLKLRGSKLNKNEAIFLPEDSPDISHDSLEGDASSVDPQTDIRITVDVDNNEVKEEVIKTTNVNNLLATDNNLLDDWSLRGGIYAMGFSGPPSRKATSPLLLPTPSTPPGAPLQPTPLMKDECNQWSNKFIHLRVRGFSINVEKLQAMEEYAFPKNEDDPLNCSEEEVYATHGKYDPNSCNLALTGSFISNSTPSNSIQHPSSADNHVEVKRKSSNNQQGSRICTGSNDADILKEQVLLLLFDSLWPQVINIIGGLVQRYAHQLVSSSSHSSRESSSTLSNRAVTAYGKSSGFGAVPKILPSTASKVDYWRRPNTVHSAMHPSPLEMHNDFNPLLDPTVEVETISPLITPSSLNQLRMARNLMQIPKSPLNPNFSQGENVVSLPSLETPRPLSSISALSTVRNYSGRQRYASLSLELEKIANNRGSNSSLSSLSPATLSPPTFVQKTPPDSFLPPIAKSFRNEKPSSALYGLISPKEKTPPVQLGARLVRRNSDTMAKAKTIQHSPHSGKQTDSRRVYSGSSIDIQNSGSGHIRRHYLRTKPLPAPIPHHVWARRARSTDSRHRQGIGSELSALDPTDQHGSRVRRKRWGVPSSDLKVTKEPS